MKATLVVCSVMNLSPEKEHLKSLNPAILFIHAGDCLTQSRSAVGKVYEGGECRKQAPTTNK